MDSWPTRSTDSNLLDLPEFNGLLFYPRADPSDIPKNAEDFFIEVDGAELHLRIHECENSIASLLIFHGNGEVVSDFDSHAARYRSQGIRLAIVDYRGYGRSTGVPTLRNVIEDSIPVFRRFRELIPALPSFVLGRSLGSACAAHLYSTQNAASLAGCVIESGFTSLSNLVQRRGFDTNDLTQCHRPFFDPIPKYRKGTAPILFVHGADDRLIMPEEAVAGFEAAQSESKKLEILNGAGHNDLLSKKEYWSAISNFIKT